MIQLCYIKILLHSFYYFRLSMRYIKFLKHCVHCCHKLENYWIWFAQGIDLRHRLFMCEMICQLKSSANAALYACCQSAYC